MDGMVTYVDLAETASRYSFQLTSLHSAGDTKEAKTEQEKVEKEEVVWKKGAKHGPSIFPLTPQWICLSTATETGSEKTTEWRFEWNA